MTVHMGGSSKVLCKGCGKQVYMTAGINGRQLCDECFAIEMLKGVHPSQRYAAYKRRNDTKG